MDDNNGFGLAPSMEAAWGLAAPATKGPKPGLSLARIVEAAVGVAAADGLGAVSMSRVAGEVGATAMALYRYVANKEELLALMVDAALGEPPAGSGPGEGWRAGLSRWAWAEHDAYLASPWVLRIPITAPPIAPHQIAWLEQGLRSLAGTGLSAGQKMSVILLISNYVRVDATLRVDLYEAFRRAHGGRSRSETDQDADDRVMFDYARTLARLTAGDRFPEITAVLKSGIMERADPPDEEFTFGLERVLDGIGVLVQPAGSGPGPA
jgi:AcrR family transcriptional regulator